jgi:hypothetical protein
MKNKLTNLNDHLFAQLERLGDEELKGEDLENELARSKALSSLSAQVIQNGRLMLDATTASLEYGGVKPAPMPELLVSKDG